MVRQFAYAMELQGYHYYERSTTFGYKPDQTKLGSTKPDMTA